MGPSSALSCFDFGKTSPPTVETEERPLVAPGSGGVLEINAEFLVPPERFLKNRVATRFVRLLNGVLEVHKSESLCRRGVVASRCIAVKDVWNVCVHFMPTGSSKKNYLCVMTPDETFNVYMDTVDELKEWYGALLKQLIRARSERLRTQSTRSDFYLMVWDIVVTRRPFCAPNNGSIDITLNHPYLLSNSGRHRIGLMTNQKTVVLILRGLNDDVEIPCDVKEKLVNGNELRVPFTAISHHIVSRNYVVIRFGRSSALGGGEARFKMKTSTEARRVFNSIRAWARLSREDAQRENSLECDPNSNPTESCWEDVVHFENLMRLFFETDNPQLDVSPPSTADKRTVETREVTPVLVAETLVGDGIGNDYKSGPAGSMVSRSLVGSPEGVVSGGTLEPQEKARNAGGYADMSFPSANTQFNAGKPRQIFSVCSYPSGSADSFMSPTVRSNTTSFNDRREARTGSRSSAKSESSDDSRARAHSMSTAEAAEKTADMRSRFQSLPASASNQMRLSAQKALFARRQQTEDHQMLEFDLERTRSNSNNRKPGSRNSSEFRSPSSSLNAGGGSRKPSSTKQRPLSAEDQMTSDTDGYLPMTYSDASTISHRPKTSSNTSTRSVPHRRSIEDPVERDEYVLHDTPIQKTAGMQPQKPAYMETIAEGYSPMVAHKQTKLAPEDDIDEIKYAEVMFGDPPAAPPAAVAAPDTPNSEKSSPRPKYSYDFSDYSQIVASPAAPGAFQTPSPKKVSTVQPPKEKT
ncbi:hypothetical protein QR680_017447 [Steinernema hermaphroditum]|uniref:IRS-type PTB domain-containing protein n=1 Tax=Steinernema hermaphroditum TaxID=289476 RepID=A0AA39HGS0_9BILA|nr:hypothetical protein QR680_017447 [Steinernema hermaphroditum]